MGSKYRIPFVSYTDGRPTEMMEYTSSKDGEVAAVENSWYSAPTEWRDNTLFSASVCLTGHGRGRSSVRVYVTNTELNETYSMAIAAFYEAVKRYGACDGVITGTWRFRKQGTNYTLWPAEALRD